MKNSATNCLKIILLISCLSKQYNAALLNGAAFTQVLKSIADDALGVAKVQEQYDKLIYRNSPLDGVGLVTEISSSLARKFDGPIQALNKIKQAVEQDINTYTTTRTFPQCCNAGGVTYSTKFQSQINTNQACVTISADSPPDSTFPNSRIEEVMKENYRNNPNLKWQYFGKEDGVYFNYPSVKLSDCSNYDPRFRPFYVSSATPVEKDVVVVIDRSGSMGEIHNSRSLLQIAKEAAISVLETLNPDDRFGVVAFDTNAYIPGANRDQRSCHGSMLARATPLNINFMKDQIRAISLGAATNYEAALNYAFRFFINTPDNGIKREKVILFLTDGEKTAGGDPLVTIRDSNKMINNSVTILTYGLGKALNTRAISMLTSMAFQNQTDPQFGEVKVGRFEHITDPSYLRSAMASYYNRFSSSETVTSPIFSVPYQDLFGIGLITSICLPLYSGKGLFGVACSDATLSDIVADISYFRQGEYSYAFIIDGTGRTLMHPMLPLPYSVKDDPIYVDIKNLERSSMAIDVINSMKAGLSGDATFHSTRTVPRGDMLYEGIETKSILSHYFWKPVSNSNFSVCIVVGDSDNQTVLDHQTVTAKSFVYHRLDLTTADGSNCRHFKRFATKDKSVVMLTPGAFREPFTYLDTEETRAQITKYENFLTGTDPLNNPGLKDSVVNSVAATYFTEDIWKNAEALSGYVVWRYIGTTDGVMRLYPGVEIAKNYDHTKRGWYKRTIALKGINVISAPYLDLWGSGYLITLSKTITGRRINGQLLSDGQTVAVMGTDFTINYFYQMLLDTYTECQSSQSSCFVIDSSGLIVMHEDFVNKTTTPQIENVHVTYKEKAIADDMLKMNIMTKTGCIDFENIKIQYSYKVFMSTSGMDRDSSAGKYRIQKVPDSNIFIIIKQRVYTSASCCQSYGKSPDSLRCSTALCDCLCYKDADFDYCGNAYKLLSDAPQTCSPREPKLQTENLNDENKIKNLPFCFDPKCSTRAQKSDCFSVAGCSWCIKDCSSQDLTKPYCALQSVCYFGQLGTKDPYGSLDGTCPTTPPPGTGGGEDTGGLGGGAVAGIIIGILIVIAIAVAAFIWYKRNQGSKPETSNSTSISRTTSSQSRNNYGHDNLAFNAQNQSAHYATPSAPYHQPAPDKQPPAHPPAYEDIDYLSPVQRQPVDPGYSYPYNT